MNYRENTNVHQACEGFATEIFYILANVFIFLISEFILNGFRNLQN